MCIYTYNMYVVVYILTCCVSMCSRLRWSKTRASAELIIIGNYTATTNDNNNNNNSNNINIDNDTVVTLFNV